MPVTLTAAVKPGDLDSVDYAEAKITAFVMYLNQKQMEIIVEWGNTVDGKWEQGLKPKSHIVLTGDDYDAVVADNATTYAAVKSDLYQYLIDEGIVAGTVT